MKLLSIKPIIHKFETAEDFAKEFNIGAGDLVITNEYIYQPFFGKLNLDCDVLYQEKYGAGEPSDDMAEAMYRDIKGDHKRVIAIGGGTVIDISKLFVLKNVSPILDLYDGKAEIVTPYFGASGTGQLNAVFPVTPQDGAAVPAAQASAGAAASLGARL